MFVPSLEPPPCGAGNSPPARVEAVGTACRGAHPTATLPLRCSGLQLRHTAVLLSYCGDGLWFVGRDDPASLQNLPLGEGGTA